MLVLDSVSKVFDAPSGSGVISVLEDISLSVQDGECLTIIGPSGCGKSTLLSCIAGFQSYTRGRIEIDGCLVEGPGVGRAVVFQHASLLPWRDVTGNVSYGMELQRKIPRAQIPNRVKEVVGAVGLTGYERYYPHQLSGGMQQRVNLARALATRPSMLLMDEPFGALDAMTKATLQNELLKLVRQEGCTTIFITHDIEEAVLLGDRVLIMSSNPGRIAHIEELRFGQSRDRSLVDSPEFTTIVRDLRAKLHLGTEQVVG